MQDSLGDAMHIEAVLPAMARENLAQAREVPDEIHASATAAMRVLRELIPWAGYELAAWDVLSGTHRHVSLASDGYSDAVLAHLNDGFVASNPGFAISHTKMLGAPRWRDYASQWNLRFSETLSAQELLIPAGFHEGTTMCLRLPDGRYTGSVHISWSSPSDAADEARDVIERFQPLLATVCDMLRSARFAADRLGSEANAVLVARDGRVMAMPGMSEGTVLCDRSPLRQALSAHARHLKNRAYLWADTDGRCRRIETMPCYDGVTLVTERAMTWPFGITAREAQVLHLIAAGLSNPEIASHLYISARTVSTHVEHILTKLSCSSRAALAATAVRENLLLANEAFGLPV